MFSRIVVLVVMLATGFASAQPAAPAPKPDQKTKAIIQGRVINSVSKEPLKRATVMLILSTGATTPTTVESDENGQFAFKDVNPGKYLIFGDKQGFARQAYGARSNPLVGTTITVAAGEEIRDLIFAAVPNSVIAGKVTDDAGEPVANATVMALRTMYRRGKKDFLPNGAGQTNDLGEYRIASLGPGRYLVVAVYRRIGIGLAGSSQKGSEDKPQPGPVTTYYPNSTDLASAAPVEVTAGGEVRGIDIRFAKAPVVSVKGKITGVPVPLSKQMLAWLTPKGAGIVGIVTRQFALVQANEGTFEFKGVPAGSYTLTTTSTDGVQDLSGVLPVDVGENPIDGLVLALGAGPNVEGSVSVSGENPPSPKGAQVVLESIETFNAAPPKTPVGEDGKFLLKTVAPDKYLIHVIGGPQELYVKSIRYGNQDVLEPGFDCTSGVAGTLEVTLAMDGAMVEGVVKGEDDKPMAAATVALIPDSKLRTRYKNATTDQRGSFSFKGVAPGAYKLLAWEAIDPGAHEDPEFVKPFESKAEKIAAKENGRFSFELKAIAAPAELRRK